MSTVSEAWQGSIRVRGYAKDMGLAGDATIVRQERPLLPGLMLVRVLYNQEFPGGCDVSFIGPRLIQVKVGDQSFTLELQSFAPQWNRKSLGFAPLTADPK